MPPVRNPNAASIWANPVADRPPRDLTQKFTTQQVAEGLRVFMKDHLKRGESAHLTDAKVSLIGIRLPGGIRCLTGEYQDGRLVALCIQYEDGQHATLQVHP